MDETLDVRLPPWFAIRNSALKGNSLKKIITYWNLIKLYSAENGCGHVSIPYTTWLSVSLWRRVLSWDFLPITTYVPPIWSIKWKKIDSRKVCCMSNKNCPIMQHMSHLQQYVYFFVYWTIHQLLFPKVDFFLQTW